ncbi:MAG: carbonic anhydrase family protein [Phycisphaerales bacterium]|nr:carbonic anhydrase family protein [Phycisphaerales bacterium]
MKLCTAIVFFVSFITCYSCKKETYQLPYDQSPIDLNESLTLKKSQLGNITLTAKPFYFSILDNGYTVSLADTASIENRNTLTFNGQLFTYEQTHFHIHSEHYLNSVFFPMELHNVYIDETNGAILVLAIFVDINGTSNKQLDTMARNFPNVKGQPVMTQSLFTLNNILPTDTSDYFSYTGSLTTPPYTGNVTWVVYKKPLETTSGQLDTFTRKYAANFRPLQEIGNRVVFERIVD